MKSSQVQSSKRERRTLLVMLAAVITPAILTLASVQDPGTRVITSANPTPYGYTLSLTLFLVPSLVLVLDLARHPRVDVERRAFLLAMVAIVALGTVLDVVFGYSFLKFPNSGATLGVRLPSFNFSELSFVPDYLPLEEFGFYILSACFMVALYAWGDLIWFQRYESDERRERAAKVQNLVRIHFSSIVVAALLIVAAILYKKLGNHPYQDGFPGYFTFLIVLALLPTALFVKAVGPFINWRALSLTIFTLLTISILMEATLGLPYGWWGYRDTEMVGIFVGVWSGLPVEAVILWLVAPWGATVAYEFWRLVLHR